MERKSYMFNAKITPVKEAGNKEFTLCKCYIMALGKNRNFSHISKEASDNAIPSLYGVPVIGHMYVDEDGQYHMGGHDMTIEKDADGVYKWKSQCVPYGFVAQNQSDLHYEDIEEPNGDTHTYLVGDIILWTGRYQELNNALYDKACWFNQSMEINCIDCAPLKEDKNYTDILSFDYSALCLLGKSDNEDENVEPCFPMARVEPYNYSFDDNFYQLMNELKSELAASLEGIGEKGVCAMDEIKDTECFSEDESAEKNPVAETAAPISEQETSEETDSENFAAAEVTSDNEPKAKVMFSASYREKYETLNKLFADEVIVDDDGNCVQEICWCVHDFTDEYVYVEKAIWDITGFNSFKYRIKYVFDEAEKTAVLDGDFEECVVKWLTLDEDAALEAMHNSYEVLIKYKADREEADKRAAYDAALAEFADLEGNAEFDAIVANKYTYNSVEELKNACYIVRGKFGIINNKKTTAANVEPAIPVSAPAEMTAREKLHAAYGKH